MKLGILSDSHDHRGAAEGALLLFRAEGVGMVFHLGDVCSPAVLAGYRDLPIPLRGVFGNNDDDRDGLQEATGGAFRQGPHIETVDGRKVLLAHSYAQLQTELTGQGRFDLVLFGHTHRPLTMHVGTALVLNPGESCGLLRGMCTCAIVDLATMEPRIVEIPLPGTG
ncbi:MAG: metallophosphoesterase [Deltaproteobacteria bacterium]|nr:metallophosphoesterase [Deltaproteobacteria bacterium]